MKDTLHIDGIDFTNEVENLDNFQIDYGLNESTQTITYSTSTSLILTGEAYAYIKSKFFNGCDYRNVLNVRLYKYCCNKTYEFKVTYEGVSICFTSCEATINLQKIDDVTRCYKQLDKTIIWDDGFCEAYLDRIPLVPYCSQPGFLHWVVFYMLPFLVTISIVFNAIVTVLEGLCDAAGGILGFLGNLFEFVIELGGLVEFVDIDIGFNCDFPRLPSPCDLVEFIGGCGKRVPAPLVKDIIEYHANKCGLSFSSTIFSTDPYMNLALFGLQVEGGKREEGRDWVCKWIEENYVNYTVIQMMDELKPVFNADYRIMDGVLYFERTDFFDNAAINIINIDQSLQLDEIEGDYCVEYIQDNACAYGRFEYNRDALDREGNRLMNEYNTIVDWNEGNEDWKDGECSILVNFGTSRFMFDRMSYEVDGLFDFDLKADNFRSGTRSDIVRIILTGTFTIAQDLLTRCPSKRRNHDLIISNDRASYPKLLVLQKDYIPDDAFVIRRVTYEKDGTEFYDYNYPMYFDEEYPEAELYQRFHYIDDPNTSGRRRYSINTITVPLTCEIADKVDSARTGIKVSTYLGEGIVEMTSIVFNGDEAFVKFSNIEIIC